MICEYCGGETPNGDPRDHYCTICGADPDNSEWLAAKDDAAYNGRQNKEMDEVE